MKLGRAVLTCAPMCIASARFALAPARRLLRSDLLARGRGGALTEAVLETARHRLEMRHAASAGCLAALGLLGPLVAPDLRRRVAATRAPLLLVMKRPLVAAGAQAVCLLVALAHRWRAITAAQETPY